jgi:hypothetical protein
MSGETRKYKNLKKQTNAATRYITFLLQARKIASGNDGYRKFNIW